MASGNTWQIAFDGFSNPAVQTLYMYPINCKITFLDNTNLKTYKSNFQSLYTSNSVNRGVPGVLSGGMNIANTNRGASTYHYISTTWPYSSNYNDISQKVTMKVQGGITCCNTFTSFALTDNITGSYTRLWYNTNLNMSVYRTNSIGNGNSIQLQRSNVINPYPIQK